MKFTFVTLFPHIVTGYFSDSILYRALSEGLLQIKCINPREFSKSIHQKVDDKKAGGGAGMLLDPVTLEQTIVKNSLQQAHIIIPQPSAKSFQNSDAKRLTRKKEIVFICGRYEGIDQRFVDVYADEVFSLGDFVLTGGELPSMAMCDAIARHIEGVLGNESSLEEESFESGLLESPSFTKPKLFQKQPIPSVFLSGNHKKMSEFKYEASRYVTQFYRPELLKRY